jgi:hypothetical protein
LGKSSKKCDWFVVHGSHGPTLAGARDGLQTEARSLLADERQKCLFPCQIDKLLAFLKICEICGEEVSRQGAKGQREERESVQVHVQVQVQCLKPLAFFLTTDYWLLTTFKRAETFMLL